MARKSALPSGALDKLIDEVTAPAAEEAGRAKKGDSLGPLRAGTPRSAKFRARSGMRPRARAGDGAARSPFRIDADAVVRYAASRGVVVEGGPMEKLRLAWQYAIDVTDLAKRERVSRLTVLSRALASYLMSRET